MRAGSNLPCPLASRKCRRGALASHGWRCAFPSLRWPAPKRRGRLRLPRRRPIAAAADVAALSINVNGTPEPGIAFVLRDPRGLLVDTETLARLKLSWRAGDTRGGRGPLGIVPLATMRGVRATIDEQAQRLDFDIDPDLLPATRLQYGLPAPQLPQTPAWGGFLNYTVYGQSTSGQNFGTSLSKSIAGAFEAVAFGPAGIFGASLSREFGRGSARAARRASCCSTPAGAGTIPRRCARCASATRSRRPAGGDARCASAACSTAPTTRCSRATSRTRC